MHDLNVTEADGELGHLRQLLQQLVGDQMGAAQRRPQVQLALEPAVLRLDDALRADQAAVRRSVARRVRVVMVVVMRVVRCNWIESETMD